MRHEIIYKMKAMDMSDEQINEILSWYILLGEELVQKLFCTKDNYHFMDFNDNYKSNSFVIYKSDIIK